MVQPHPVAGSPEFSLFDAFGTATLAASFSAAVSQVRHWVGYTPFSEPSKQRLLEHALRGLGGISGGAIVANARREQVMLVLYDLIADAQPTPQVAVGEGGDIETLWLVNGTEVVLNVEPDGSGVLAAYSPDDEIFEYEFDELTDPLDRAEIAEARRLLNALGESVTRRLLS